MRLERCPSCNGYLNFSMDYNCGNPVIVYTCANCRYATFGEAYITDNKTTMTSGCSISTNSTEAKYEPIGSVRNDNMTVYTIGGKSNG